MNALLESEVFGHMASADERKPYIVPMAYVFHDNALYGQTTEGKKVAMLRKNPQVCFQVESVKDHRWKSVVCWGIFEELDFKELQKAEAIEIVELLTRRIGSIQEKIGISVPFSFAGGALPLKVNEKQSTLFRIAIQEKTGRFYTAEQ